MADVSPTRGVQAMASEWQVRKEMETTSLKMKLEMAEDYVDKLRGSLRETEDKLQEARKTYFTVVIEKESVRSDFEAEKRRCEKLLNDKQEIQALLQKRTMDMKIMDNEASHLRQKLVALSGDSLSASIKNESIELRESSLRQKEARLEQESKIRDQRIVILEQEVDQLAKQLATAQKERTISLGEMQSSLEQKIAEVVRLKEELIHYKRTVDQKDQHIAVLAGEISQHQVNVMSLETAFKLEIEALNRLVDAQKNVTQDERKKCDKLLTAVNELEKIRKTAEESHSQMEEALSRSAANFQEKIEAKNKVIDVLEKELDDLRDQLAAKSKDEYERQLQSYFPAASTASRMLRDRSSVGATEVSRMSGEIESLRSENEKLSTEIRKLIAEAEERTPLFHGKIMEQKNTLEYLDDVMKELASITAEKEEWDRERDTLIQLNSQSGREKDRFRQENEDLSRQVQQLVHTNNELRGNSLRNQFSHRQSPISFAQQSSANQVISQHLVTFDSIGELQQRNQQLLAALRSLSDEKDEDERSCRLSTSTGRDDRLEEALRELENLKRERRDNMQRMDELLKQRDAIKLMLGTLTPSSASDPFNDSNVSASNVSSLESQITFLSKRIEKLESENAKIREDAEARIKELNELLLSSRDEVAAAQIAQMTAVTLQSTAEQKADEIRKALDELRSNYDLLLAQCEKMQAENRKNRNESRAKSDEITSLKGELRRAQASLSTLTQERNAAVLREKELQIQLEDIKRDNMRMSSFSETAKNLSAYVEKCQADERRQNVSQTIIEKLEKENCELKASLELLQKQLDDVREAEAIELRETQAKLTASTELNDKLTQQLETTRRRVAMLQKQLADSKAEVKPDLSKKVAELESQLKLKDEELVRLNEAHDATVQRLSADYALLKDKNTKNVQIGSGFKNKMTELQAKVIQLEKTMEEMTKATDESKRQRDEALETSRKVSEGLQKQNDDLVKMNQELLVKLQSRPVSETVRVPDATNQMAGLRSVIDGLNITIAELRAEREAAVAEAAAAREESKVELKKLAAKASSKLQAQRQDIEKKQEEMEKKDEEIRQKDETIGRLTQETEACECLRLRSLISQHENKIIRLESDLQEANSSQRTKKPVVSQPVACETIPSQPVFCQSGPSSAPALVSPAPLRHPVLPTPQQQPSPKGPPTASIRPLPHARSSVAVPAQPTIATVLPTQATVGVVAPSTPSEQPAESAQVQEEQVPDEVDPLPEVAAQIPTPSSPQLPIRSENHPADSRPGLKRSHSTQEEGPDRSRLRTNEAGEEASVSLQAPAPAVAVQEAAVPSPGAPTEPDPAVPAADVHGEERRSPNQESAMRGDDSGDQDVIILDSDDGGEDEAPGDGQESSPSGEGDDDEAGGGSDEDSDSDSDYDDGMEAAPVAINEYAESGESAEHGEEVGMEEGNQDAEADEQMEEAEVDVSAIGGNDPPAQVFAQPRDRSTAPRPGFFIQSTAVQVPQSYEDLGDGIVPSTPTLFVPRRDGSESLNSPCVPQSSFQFSSAPNQAVAESALGIETVTPDPGDNRNSSPPPESVVPEVSEVAVIDAGGQIPETINLSSDVGTSPARSQDEPEQEQVEDLFSRTNTNSSGASQENDGKDQQGDDSCEPRSVSGGTESSAGPQSTERGTRQRRPIVWSPQQQQQSASTSFSQPSSAAAFSFVPPELEQQPQPGASSSNIAQLQESIRGRQLRVRGAAGTNRARRALGWRGSRGTRGGRGSSQ